MMINSITKYHDDFREADSVVAKNAIQAILKIHLEVEEPNHFSTPLIDEWAFQKIYLVNPEL